MTSDLNAFDAEAQSGRGAERLSPLHVSGLEDALLGLLLLCGGAGVHGYHLLVHVLPKTWPLSGFDQLLLQICPLNVNICGYLFIHVLHVISVCSSDAC